MPIIPHLKIQPLKPQMVVVLCGRATPIIPHLKIQPLKLVISLNVKTPVNDANNPSSKNPTTETTRSATSSSLIIANNPSSKNPTTETYQQEIHDESVNQ